MAFKIAIASGKGGTGKTTVSVNLFSAIYKYWTENVQLFDCDVEEPNDLLFFKDFTVKEERKVFLSVPEIDIDACKFCKKCEEYCEFNAIVVMPKVKYAKVSPDLCHSCGACLVACPHDAIHEKDHAIGSISVNRTKDGGVLKEGNLRVGSPLQTMLIKELKKESQVGQDIVIYDAPPGISCPVVETISDADFVILVTEPTPFGMYDLQLTVDLMREMKKSFAVLVNKAGMGNAELYEYLEREKIKVLGEIPFDKNYAAQYSKGMLLTNIPSHIKQEYLKLVDQIKIISKEHEGDYNS